MDRRFFVRTLAVGGGAAALFPQLTIGRLSSEGAFAEIRRGVGTYTNRGGTIGWMINPDGVVVVDTQFREQAEDFVGGLKARTKRKIDLLLNTHHHRDHTSGNVVLVAKSANSVAHENCRLWQEKSAVERGTEAEQAYPSATFSDTWSMEVGDEVVNAQYYGRAHTSGDAVIHFEKADVVHMGDLVFNRYPCFIDRDSGAVIKGWMGVLETLHDQYTDETIFIHGHFGEKFGPTGSRADLLVMRDFLSGLLEFAQQGINEGKTEDEVAETLRLPKFPDHYFEDWRNGVSNALRKAYQELSEG